MLKRKKALVVFSRQSSALSSCISVWSYGRNFMKFLLFTIDFKEEVSVW